MTDGPETSIQLACCTWLQTGAAAWGFPVSYPFTVYAPTLGTPYLDARGLLRAAPQSLGIAYAGSVLRRGIFQVDAVTMDDVGEAPGIRMAELIAALFAQGTMFTAGNKWLVKVNQVPTIAAAVMDAPWLRFPVSIPYTVST